MRSCQDKLVGGKPVNFFSTASAKGPLKGEAKKVAKMEKEKKTIMTISAVKTGIINHIMEVIIQSGNHVGIKLLNQTSN